MLKTWMGTFALLALLAGCAPLPPSQSAQQVKIEGTPGLAVVYVVRTNPDVSYVPAQIVVGENMIGTTHAGTYYRLELPAGRHRISGYASDNGSLNIDIQADRVYFIQHTVSASWRTPSPHSFFRLIDEARARAAMAGASRAG